MMDRKGFLGRVTLLGGCTLVAPAVLMQGCKVEPRTWASLSTADIALLDELGETILPQTAKLPGAKAVEVGKYVVQIVNDCLTTEDQDVFLNGLESIDSRSVVAHGKPFEKLSSENRKQLLTALQQEAIAYAEEQEGAEEPKVHYFSILKELVVTGYFTSKTVITEGFNYGPIPGKYVGCINYDASKDKVYKG